MKRNYVISNTDQFPEKLKKIAPKIKKNKALLDTLSSFTEIDRYNIVDNLSSFNTDISCWLLREILLDDPSPLVRHEAAFQLGQNRDKVSRPVLKYVLNKDSSSLVRHEAAIALAEIGSPSDIRALKDGLRDRNREVRMSCEIALYRIQRKRIQNAS